MANLRILWNLPTTRESGAALAPTDIKHVRVELSADGATYALVGDFPPTVTETLVEALDTGEWFVRGLVADLKGRVSQPAVKSVVIDETAPGVVTFTLTLE